MMIIFDDGTLDNYEEDATPWIALADMMTGLMAIFLALAIAILVSQQHNKIVIIKDIASELKAKNINIDQKEAEKGNIVLSERVAFDVSQAILKPEGKAFLDKFAPVYAKAIFELEPEKLKMINRLIIEGHTDSSGIPQKNMQLSNERAMAIINYIYTMPDFKYKYHLLRKLTVSGRGANDSNKSTVLASDRKVVFRIDFKSSFEQEAEKIKDNIKKEVNQ